MPDRIELTDKHLQAAAKKPASKGARRYEWDSLVPSFGIRVTDRGVISFIVMKRVAGETPIRLTLGRYPAIPLAIARQKAREALGVIQQGRDPRTEVARQRAAERQQRANTVAQVAERYLTEITPAEAPALQVDGAAPKRKGRTKRGKKLASAGEVRRILEKYIVGNESTAADVPVIGQRVISEVDLGELVELFDAIADVHGGVMANRALAWTRRLFKWAIGKGIVKASPAAGIERPGEERTGTRTLSDDEIRQIWAAAERLGYPIGHYVNALLLTGRRRTSVATMRRSEIDRDRRVWAPGGGAANKNVPELPLFGLLEGLLDRIPEQKAEGGDYVFSARARRDVAVNSFDEMKKDLDAAIAAVRKAAGIEGAMPHWTFHDARRTVKTRLAELGVPKEIRDLIMGHARQGMDKVYDHSERREEKRRGLERWAAHLQEILNPSTGKIVRLRR
jgi:integrase